MAPSTGLREPLLPPPRPTVAGAPTSVLPRSARPITLTASRVDIDPESVQTTQQKAHERRQEAFGLFLNALSTLFGTGMSLFAKISGSQGIGVFEIVLTRSLILVLFTGPELLYFRVNPFRDRNRRWLLVLRGVLGFLSVSSLYLAVSLLPLADASVLSFISPIFVACLSPFILREKTSRGVLVGIPVAMVGVLLVAQPSFLPWFGGSAGISLVGVTVGLMQALFNSLARISVRALSMGSSERMSSIIFGQGIISCLGAALMCTITKKFVVPTELPVWGALLAGGFLGYLYQLALTGGLQRARAAPAVAMSYLSVIWGIIADIVVFHDMPDKLGLVGAAIICMSSFCVAYGQKRSSAQKSAEAAVAAAAAQRQASAARLAQEQEQAGAADLRQPLLTPAEQGGEGEWRGRGAPGSASSGEWASPAGPGNLSAATSMRSIASWHTAGSAGTGEEDGVTGLKAEVKVAAAAAAAHAAAAEVQAPPTPAAPPHLQPHPSAESLPPLGSSPGSDSVQGVSPLAYPARSEAVRDGLAEGGQGSRGSS